MILRAQKSDASELSELVNSAYRGESSRLGWSTEADLLGGTRTDTSLIQETLDKPETVILKYVGENNEILGCVELDRRLHKIYLGMLTVKPSLQSKGIGKALLKAGEEEAIRQGCSSIFMTVISVRDLLIAWYLRHGYRDTGVRKPVRLPNERWGIPKTELEFVVLEKTLQTE